MIETILPPWVAAVEQFRHDADDRVVPGAQQIDGAADDDRWHRQFGAGRRCAREALAQLGVDDGRIPRGNDGEPLWPRGVTGSITHCKGYCAAAVSLHEKAIGIDAEPNLPISQRALDAIATPIEQDLLRRLPGDVRGDRLHFSVKESVYKAWFPCTGRRLRFRDVVVELAVDGSFRATAAVPSRLAMSHLIGAMEGRWLMRDDLIASVAVLGR